jgi:hypothetical protein
MVKGRACSVLTTARSFVRYVDSPPQRQDRSQMPDRDEFQRLAKMVREIAAGIFDKGERRQYCALFTLRKCSAAVRLASPPVGGQRGLRGIGRRLL